MDLHPIVGVDVGVEMGWGWGWGTGWSVPRSVGLSPLFPKDRSRPIMFDGDVYYVSRSGPLRRTSHRRYGVLKCPLESGVKYLFLGLGAVATRNGVSLSFSLRSTSTDL